MQLSSFDLPKITCHNDLCSPTMKKNKKDKTWNKTWWVEYTNLKHWKFKAIHNKQLLVSRIVGTSLKLPSTVCLHHPPKATHDTRQRILMNDTFWCWTKTLAHCPQTSSDIIFIIHLRSHKYAFIIQLSKRDLAGTNRCINAISLCQGIVGFTPTNVPLWEIPI